VDSGRGGPTYIIGLATHIVSNGVEKCPFGMTGNPLPTIKWYKDGKPFIPTSNFYKRTKMGLRLMELTKANEAIYTCEASNVDGLKIQYNISLIISRKCLLFDSLIN
jgi:hypothetical protein